MVAMLMVMAMPAFANHAQGFGKVDGPGENGGGKEENAGVKGGNLDPPGQAKKEPLPPGCIHTKGGIICEPPPEEV